VLEKGADAGMAAHKKRGKGLDLLELRLNEKGYDMLGSGKVKESIELFRTAVLAFPRSSNAFDSLGEAYLEAGNKPLAIENYNKSLALDPANGNAADVLKKLAP
jgi:tetratricopeptide (TPR) repeat protein